MRQSADTVLTQLVREAHPDISDANIPEAITQIDMSQRHIGARIFGGAFFESSSNSYHCRGMGFVGDGILKTTPGFQKKGGSSSSQVAQLQSRVEQMAVENARLTAGYARMLQHQREMAAWNQTVADVQMHNAAMTTQWLQDFMMA